MGVVRVYVREELIEQLEPPIVGWFLVPGSEDLRNYLNYNLTYFANVRRFKLMILVHDVAAMGKSVELLLELGPITVEAYVHALANGRSWAWMAEHALINRLTKLSTGNSLDHSSEPARGIERLRATGVVHSLREAAIRLAPYF